MNNDEQRACMKTALIVNKTRLHAKSPASKHVNDGDNDVLATDQVNFKGCIQKSITQPASNILPAVQHILSRVHVQVCATKAAISLL